MPVKVVSAGGYCFVMDAQPFRLTKPPWSKNQLRRLGNALRDGDDVSLALPNFEDVLFWHLQLGQDVAAKIDSLDWTPLGLKRLSETSASRPKTIETLVEKLRRDRSTPLSNVGDLAGVRIGAEMTLSVQDALADSVREVLASEIGSANVQVKDLRAGEHSGYRAMHVLATFPAGRCEIQIRTRLQTEWAN